MMVNSRGVLFRLKAETTNTQEVQQGAEKGSSKYAFPARQRRRAVWPQLLQLSASPSPYECQPERNES